MPSSRIEEYITALRKSDRLGHQVAGYQRIGGRHGKPCNPPADLPPDILRFLSGAGIKTLHCHQAQALQSIREGNHTVVATPTASGKSLIYNLALFEATALDRQARGLYVFPLKALTRDQYENFQHGSGRMTTFSPTAAVYDGDTSAYQRQKIRRAPPNVIMTNLEMIHLALLPYHPQWRTFFKHLKLVVIDEVHTYRGILGAHCAQVLRRLRRVCDLYGAKPTFVFTSATVANPGFLTRQLTGLDVAAVTRGGAPGGSRHLVILDGRDGPSRSAILLLKAAMARQLRTIVYTQSRKMAELITLWVQQQSGKFREKIGVYRAGLLPAQRREIEADLKQGRLLAVVSTSALELGIDIGDLDLCILVGYPGSMIATHQRAGRVGRKGQDAALIMIAGEDALDQFFIAKPKAFFQGRAEAAVINPHNPVVMEAHLPCAAVENPLDTGNEAWLKTPEAAAVVARLEKSGRLLRSENGHTLYARRKRPHMDVDLRSAGQRFRIMDKDACIGEINGFRVYREAHPGAVYLHQGASYVVESIDEPAGAIHVHPRKVDYYTRVSTESDIHIEQIINSKNVGNTDIYFGKIKVVDNVIGYEKRHTGNGRSLGYTPLTLPPMIFETESIWLQIPSDIRHRVSQRGYDLLGSLHAAEHAAISIMPLLVLADRNDIGGLATPHHPQAGCAAIFIYDGLPGGAGMSLQAFQYVRDMMDRARDVIQRCECDQGCPACVHSSKCGSGNQPMDKAGALFLLGKMASRKKGAKKTPQATVKTGVRKKARPPKAGTPLNYGVFDLETQRSAQEVGGWHMAHLMKVSCGVVYDSRDDTYAVYLESEIDRLIDHLGQLDLVIGFNSKRFDYRVLSGYSQYPFERLPSLDLLEQVHHQMGFRLSLDHLARETLAIGKSGSGLDALRWWQSGEMDKIIEYCRKDVQITRDLYLYAKENGYLIFKQKDGARVRIPLRI